MADLALQPLHVVAGSGLDLSSLRLTATPAGSRGRITASGSDLMESGVSVRMNVATWAPDSSEVPLPMDKAACTAAAEHLARQGFNAMRLHGVEYWLMHGTTGAFNFPADKLDMFYWFMAECKRVGLYWIINPRAPELYQDGEGGSRWAMPVSARDMKVRLFIQQDARDHWHTGFNTLYNRVNPYTGLNILQDPALFMVECINECSAQQSSQVTWPAVWTTRDGPQGGAAKTWNEWLADSAQAHGYANLAALNTSWGTAYGSFSAIPAPTGNLPNLTMPLSQLSIDVVLYCCYLDDSLADFFTAEMAAFGYTGLYCSLISFPNAIQMRNAARKSANQVVNLHDYPFLAVDPGPGVPLKNSAPNTQVWSWESWMVQGGMYSSGKPVYLGEYGWPHWGQWRNQYPMLAAYAAHNGVAGISHFHQGDFFDPSYSASSHNRTKYLFPYSGHADPVVTFSQAATFFSYHLGYVSEGVYEKQITLNDRYYGVSPRNTGRINRAFFKLFVPPGLLPGVVKTTVNWTADTSDDSLAVTLNATDWATQVNDLRVAGVLTDDNRAYMSSKANNGTITAVETTGTIGTVTASATQPVLTIGSNTLVDGDHIAMTNIAGSGGTWPGTNDRGTRCVIKQTGVANKVQITSGLNLTGLSGFTSGTWCEFANVAQTGNKQIYYSRREKVAWVNTPKYVYFSDGGASGVYPYRQLDQVRVMSMTSGAAFFVASADNTRLMASKSLVVGLVGNVKNTGQTFTDSTNVTINTVGTSPIQLDDVTVTFRLTVDVNAYVLCKSLMLSGSVSAPVTVTPVDEFTVSITCTTAAGNVFFKIDRTDNGLKFMF